MPEDGANLGDADAPPIRAIAYDPEIGTIDGEGISYVMFVIRNQANVVVYLNVESSPGYCAFGGNTTCEAPTGGWWSWLPPGTYTITAYAHSSNGKPGATTSITFTRQ